MDGILWMVDVGLWVMEVDVECWMVYLCCCQVEWRPAVVVTDVHVVSQELGRVQVMVELTIELTSYQSILCIYNI